MSEDARATVSVKTTTRPRPRSANSDSAQESWRPEPGATTPTCPLELPGRSLVVPSSASLPSIVQHDLTIQRRRRGCPTHE